MTARRKAGSSGGTRPAPASHRARRAAITRTGDSPARARRLRLDRPCAPRSSPSCSARARRGPAGRAQQPVRGSPRRRTASRTRAAAPGLRRSTGSTCSRCSCRSPSPTPASPRSTTASPRSPSRSRRTRRCRGPTSLTLDDDRGMVGQDRLVPVARRDAAARATAAGALRLRALLNRVSRVDHDAALRALNQQVADGRLPEAVGGEFVDAQRARHAGPPARARPADRDRPPVLRRGRDGRAPLRRRAARRRLPRRRPRRGGFRPELVAALRSRRASTSRSATAARCSATSRPTPRSSGGVRAPPAARARCGGCAPGRSARARARTATCS